MTPKALAVAADLHLRHKDKENRKEHSRSRGRVAFQPLLVVCLVSAR
jgi:hypothetical protein